MIEEPEKFKYHCMCGSHAYTLNGKPENISHMSWCPQFEEWKKLKEETGKNK